MAILKSKSKVIAAKLEAVFNTAETLTSADTLEIKESSNVTTTLATVSRKVIRDSLLTTPVIPIRENTSSTIDVELLPSGVADDILGDALLEAGMGKKSPAGLAGSGTGAFIGFSDDGATPADIIYMAQAGDTNDSTAVAYILNKPSGITKSLTIKEFLGTSKSVETIGNVVSSIKISLPTADVASMVFSVEGCGFATNESDTKLTPVCSTNLPYLGKSATFKFDGVTVAATDVSIDITNTIFNEESLIVDGYSSKSITSQEIKGSFTALFEDYSMLTKFKNNVDGSLYVSLSQGANTFAIYIQKLKLTSFSKSDNSGVMSQTVEFQVPYDCSGGIAEPIIVASQVA